MQVERVRGQLLTSGARVRNTWVINPLDWDNPGKLGLIPDVA